MTLKKTRRSARAPWSIAALALLAGHAWAGVCTVNDWDLSPGSWHDHTNWSLGVVPDCSHIARFESFGGSLPVIAVTINDPAEACQLFVRRVALTVRTDFPREELLLCGNGTDPEDSSIFVSAKAIQQDLIGTAELIFFEMDVVGDNAYIGAVGLNEGFSHLIVVDSSLNLAGKITVAGNDDVDNSLLSVLYPNGLLECDSLVVGLTGLPGKAFLQGTNSTNAQIVANAVEVGNGATAKLVLSRGTLTATSGVVVYSTGVIESNEGLILGDVDMRGMLSPGINPSTPDQLTVDGDFDFASTATYEVGINDTTSDRLFVDLDATLDGTLDVSLLGTADPVLGKVYTIVTADSVSGTFDTVLTPSFSDCRNIRVVYCADRVRLVVAGVPGDANYDGVVDNDDLDIVLNNYFVSGCLVPGDVNFDGVVNFSDMNLVLINSSQTCN